MYAVKPDNNRLDSLEKSIEKLTDSTDSLKLEYAKLSTQLETAVQIMKFVPVVIAVIEITFKLLQKL